MAQTEHSNSADRVMAAVVFDGPYQVSVQQRPVPTLQDQRDIIVKVHSAALCGSELHVYRGRDSSPPGFIMGHEFTGIVVQAGSSVQSVKIGDKVVSPFTVSCMQCFYCRSGYSARCIHSLLFGSSRLDGGQAEYVRVPLADGTVMKAPHSVSDNALILMADIWPTGYFGVTSAYKMLGAGQVSAATIVVVGCGPVGLCAVIAAREQRPKHLFAVDSVESRLALAKTLGAEPLNFQADRDGMERMIREVTDGRGADAVVEAVGSSPALRIAFDIVRPFGVIASIGVHNAEIPWSGDEGYSKNLRLQMGRCPVRSIFPDALAMLEKEQDSLAFMFDKTMPLSNAVEGYKLFEEKKVQKIIFTP